ncbi:hypothetical protein MSG28_000616 [Choristoneura fumiferana]|uniref:Uncharacterized protein n=1 Tax=Choristoneura fumiferana TaxID=7141 RepID=A0ACC0K247_CHOFU|nr:hypothetical protein MSG28_000616 [Choristoneura fumiferana]
MNWKLLLCLAVANWMSVYSRDIAQLRKLLESIQRKLSDKSQGVLRQLDNQEEDISTVTEPNDIDDDIEVVPRDEPTPPGHSLIKPSSDTLESAAKYPVIIILRKNPYPYQTLDLESSESDESLMMTRRRGKKHKSRQPYYASETEVNVTHSSSESESSSNDESSDYEKNPGNPYTIVTKIYAISLRDQLNHIDVSLFKFYHELS